MFVLPPYCCGRRLLQGTVRCPRDALGETYFWPASMCFDQRPYLLILSRQTQLCWISHFVATSPPFRSIQCIVAIAPLFSGDAMRKYTPRHYGSLEKNTRQFHKRNNGPRWVENVIDVVSVPVSHRPDLECTQQARIESERRVYELVYCKH